MRDLFFIAFLGLVMLLGLRRPFLMVLVYAYIDIVSPQRLSYFLLNSIPISLIAFVAAVGAWLAFDNKSDTRLSRRQGIMVLLLIYCAYTTAHADFPLEAAEKWGWVWKALIFAIFLPLTLRTRLRIEALSLVMVLCASSIIITGGIKTALSGGGYGSLYLLTDSNSGLYEGSTISAIAVGLIPLILYFANHGTIFPPDRKTKIFAYGLAFACVLIPIGTQARTGLVCLAVIGGLAFLQARHKLLFGAAGAIALVCAVPFLPAKYLERMDTLANYKGDESASTRVQVWKWTLDYVQKNPVGGGFDAYRGNSFRYETVTKHVAPNGDVSVERMVVEDKGRAYHSAYFEMLGEQGYAGLALWLVLNFGTVFQTWRIRSRYRSNTNPSRQWVAPYAQAMVFGHISYLVGSLFVGIAYQPFVFMLIALQIALTTYLRRIERAEAWQPIVPPQPADRVAQTI